MILMDEISLMFQYQIDEYFVSSFLFYLKNKINVFLNNLSISYSELKPSTLFFKDHSSHRSKYIEIRLDY
jgi:hypothetical protein